MINILTPDIVMVTFSYGMLLTLESESIFLFGQNLLGNSDKHPTRQFSVIEFDEDFILAVSHHKKSEKIL